MLIEPKNILRVYIRSPMRGIADLNHLAFAAEVARFRSLGYQMVRPVEINHNGCAWQECMKKDIAQLTICDLLAWLSGWSNSRGARIETSLARNLAIKTVMARSITEKCAEAA